MTKDSFWAEYIALKAKVDALVAEGCTQEVAAAKVLKLKAKHVIAHLFDGSWVNIDAHHQIGVLRM